MPRPLYRRLRDCCFGRSPRGRRAARPPSSRRLIVEELEDRRVLSPITKVQDIGTATLTGAASSSTLTIPIPARGVAAGDTVIVEFVSGNPSAPLAGVTDTQSNTYTQDARVTHLGGQTTFVFSGPVTTALTGADHITIMFQFPVQGASASATEFTGLLAVSPKDQSSTNTTFTVGPRNDVTSGPTPVTTQPNELLFGAVGVETGGPAPPTPTVTFTPGAGYTALASAAGNFSPGSPAVTVVAIEGEYRVVSATGAYAADGTLRTSTGVPPDWDAAIVTYKAADQTGGQTGPPAGTPTQRFVSQMYLDLLNRPVDSAGMAYWGGLIDGGLSHTEAARLIQRSAEFLTDEVRAAFQHYLHRPADNAGLTFYVPLLESGGTVEQMGEMMVTSAEYRATRGITSGDSFLDVVYSDVLNRAVDPAGRGVWDRALAGGASFAQIASIIFSSREYDLDLVNRDYTRYLRRPVDPVGTVIFVFALQDDGARDEDVTAVIVGSPEYAARL